MTAGRVVTPEDVNSMVSHLFELAAASDSLGSQLPFAAVDPNVCFAGLFRSSLGFVPMSVGYAFLPLGAVQREKMRCIPYHINSPFAFKEVQLARAHRIILKWSSILAFPQFLLTLSAEVENINIVRDL
jgi:hypothetical protein